MKRFMVYLRTTTSQSKLSFFSDVSREHIRCIEKGKKNPSVKVFINLINAAGLDVKEALCIFADMLNEEYESLLKSEKAAGLAYIYKTKENGKTKKAASLKENKAAKVLNTKKKTKSPKNTKKQ